MMKGLHPRWMRLWNEAKLQGGNPDQLYQDLRARYAEPWRVYHTSTHIKAMLTEFDALCDAISLTQRQKHVIQMAVWYHDAVYNLQAHDNEERSVQLFKSIGNRYCWDAGFMLSVSDAILVTKHTSPPRSFEHEIICDLDLVILGKPSDMFARYETQIRKEYEFVPPEVFRRERVAILQNFLNRSRIYSIGFFYEEYEAQARENLRNSIARLSEGK